MPGHPGADLGHVVAGSLKDNLEAMGAKVLPETTKARLHRGLTEPGSADK